MRSPRVRPMVHRSRRWSYRRLKRVWNHFELESVFLLTDYLGRRVVRLGFSFSFSV